MMFRFAFHIGFKFISGSAREPQKVLVACGQAIASLSADYFEETEGEVSFFSC